MLCGPSWSDGHGAAGEVEAAGGVPNQGAVSNHRPATFRPLGTDRLPFQ